MRARGACTAAALAKTGRGVRAHLPAFITVIHSHLLCGVQEELALLQHWLRLAGVCERIACLCHSHSSFTVLGAGGARAAAAAGAGGAEARARHGTSTTRVRAAVTAQEGGGKRTADAI